MASKTFGAIENVIAEIQEQEREIRSDECLISSLGMKIAERERRIESMRFVLRTLNEVDPK